MYSEYHERLNLLLIFDGCMMIAGVSLTLETADSTSLQICENLKISLKDIGFNERERGRERERERERERDRGRERVEHLSYHC